MEVKKILSGRFVGPLVRVMLELGIAPHIGEGNVHWFHRQSGYCCVKFTVFSKFTITISSHN